MVAKVDFQENFSDEISPLSGLQVPWPKIQFNFRHTLFRFKIVIIVQCTPPPKAQQNSTILYRNAKIWCLNAIISITLFSWYKKKLKCCRYRRRAKYLFIHFAFAYLNVCTVYKLPYSKKNTVHCTLYTAYTPFTAVYTEQTYAYLNFVMFTIN